MAFKIKVSDIKKELPQHTREVILNTIKQYFDDIKEGKIISKPYSLSTKKRRAKYGLPTDRVRLFGSNSYSNKSWRLLTAKHTKWKIKGKKIIVEFKREISRKLWRIHKNRYGDLK